MLPHHVSAIDAHLAERLRPLADWAETELRCAAVLCPIVCRNDAIGDELLFVLRPAGSDAHAGQIAFPGGKQEADESPVETALRECFEEVGAPIDAATPLGELRPRVSTSRYSVHCVVARVEPFEVRAQPAEVDRVLFVPLRALRDLQRWQELPPPAPLATGRQPRTSPHFVHDGDRIWGLTGRFVRELVQALDGPDG